MKNLLLISISIFTTVTLMSACGENGTGNATENVVVDSTQNATDVVKDTLVKK